MWIRCRCCDDLATDEHDSTVFDPEASVASLQPSGSDPKGARRSQMHMDERAGDRMKADQLLREPEQEHQATSVRYEYGPA